jgi:hypothetical protein
MLDRLLGECGIRRDTAAGRREFGELMEARRRVEGHADEKPWSEIWQGWRCGAAKKAWSVGGQSLKKREMHLKEARALKKSNPLKIELAAELRKLTAVSVRWIAKELNDGAPNSVWNAMKRLKRGSAGVKEIHMGICGAPPQETPRSFA